MNKKQILLGITGSVAAIKTPLLVEKLQKANYEVRIVVTNNAIKFFNMSDLTTPIYKDEDEWSFWKQRGDPVLHIQLRDWADIFLIAPLSANCLAKLAYGLADNLLTTIARAWWFPSQIEKNQTEKPVYFAPAMNTLMWEHPFTNEHIKCLTEKLLWKCINPIRKKLVCGTDGMGAMAELDDIVNFISK